MAPLRSPAPPPAGRHGPDWALLAERLGGLLVGLLLSGALALDALAVVQPDPTVRIAATNGAFVAVAAAFVLLGGLYLEVLRRERRPHPAPPRPPTTREPEPAGVPAGRPVGATSAPETSLDQPAKQQGD